MKLDVTDLFDHLYDVASFARARFKLGQTQDEEGDFWEWNEFCQALSDSLFLPACAARVYALTHTRMKPNEIKARLITEFANPGGTKTYYSRYLRPGFSEGRYFYANMNGVDEPEYPVLCPSVSRKLQLWLGKLPPSEIETTPPAYPADLETPFRYYAKQFMGMHSRSPHTSYYEFHGDWCFRQVRQDDAVFTRDTLGGQWRKFEGLSEIPKESFEAVWDAAQDDVASSGM